LETALVHIIKICRI